MTGTVQAILCDRFGSTDDLHWGPLTLPECGPDQVRYRTTAATVGFMDTLMVEGLYQLKPDLPYVPGAVSAGVVTEVGSNIGDIAVGDRVSALGYHGGFATARVVDRAAVVVTPEGIDDEQAAAFRLTYSPSYLALVLRARIQPGETLVVTGATGGIGFSAMQLGRHLGARVIGAVGGADKVRWLNEQGFDETIDYGTQPFKQTVNEMTGGLGADVIFEVVGGEMLEQSMRCINVFGRILVLGFAGGDIPALPANLPLLKNAAIIGSFLGGWMTRDPAAFMRMNGEVVDVLRNSDLRAPIAHRFPMHQASEAMATLRRRDNIGKIMLTV